MKYQKIWMSLILVLASSCMEPRKNFIEKSEAPTKKEVPPFLQGQLIDSQVSGVEYRTTSKKTGLTDKNGYFQYIAGDEIEFMIGKLHLGQTKAQTVLTPIELANKNTVNHPEVVNRLRLLQSLDSDQNPANGISITENIRSQVFAISFSQEQDLFEKDAKALLQQVCSSCQLTDASKAINHFQKRLAMKPQEQLLTGILKSPTPLIGVGYRLNSGYLGKTDNQGQFLYKANESIRFFIDEINLGDLTAKEEITVLDLAKTTNIMDFSVLNRQTLLMILDKDKDVLNGIDVSDFSSQTTQLSDRDYNITPQAFKKDSRISNILETNNVSAPPSTQIISYLKTTLTSHNIKYSPLGTIQHLLDFSHTGLASSSHQILAKDNNIYALSQTSSNKAILRKCHVEQETPCDQDKEIATTDMGVNVTMAFADQFYFAMANTTNDIHIVTCDSTFIRPCANPRKLDTGGQKTQSTINLSLSTNDRGIATKIYVIFSHSVDGLFLSECSHPDDGNPCAITRLNTPSIIKTSAMTFKQADQEYVYIAAESQEGKLVLAYCTMDPKACQASTLSTNANEGKSSSIALKNGSTNYVWIASMDQSQGNKPMFTRCSRRSDQTVYFGSCTRFDVISKVKNEALQQALKMTPMFSPHLYIRNDNEILLLVQAGQSDARTNLFRCSFDNDDNPTNCRWFDLSKGQANLGYLPRLAVQENTAKLLLDFSQRECRIYFQIF